MSAVGIVMLVHTALDRAEQVARHWAASGCPVVIHADRSVPAARFRAFVRSLSDVGTIRFSSRHRCEWGTWGIVAATQAASAQMLRDFPEVRHVYLASGSCLPLRPVQELIDYLDARPRTDFIESATTSDVPWTVGGLDSERFTMRFPFAWKRNRRLFDAYVRLQRRLGLKRRMPNGITPHMGSQWWCLTRQTLSAILQDPERADYDRFFKRVWIPDESYFQTLARLYSGHIESRSLTLSKFDFQGKPHIFYDDHLQLLRRSDCFVARKIWPRADRLYEAFLTDADHAMKRTEPNPGKIDRIFARAVERRTRGRPGLHMQSRFPNPSWDHGPTGAQYAVFQGFADLFEDFEPWLARKTGCKVHGHIYASGRAAFSGGQPVIAGAIPDSAAIRDYRPAAFLTNLIWASRGEHQCFQFGPNDNQGAAGAMSRDPNARISVISGAWAVPLFTSNRNFGDLRAEAARLQKIESDFLDLLRGPHAKARIRIWTMAEFVDSPMEPLQEVIDDLGAKSAQRLSEAPKMVNLAGFGQFLQNLKNQGMHPYLMGDFPTGPTAARPRPGHHRKPYLVKK
ncbi:core-2/I-branching enzyme family protein [Pseudooceanicola batsensis HTCC2597]|uniref:Peptide O-xylosyltransferase n=1 Tax=Pseudooceanicola batsensis (strain ATCC BAA-863 / DSM 15984 / KCTC 12145 / HTCC2597) TaxID=252305 RepID=A3TWD9_PSEBH|nr:beta-1,6-N-acetylglucosaminyltransferase [Pseudooceanicola batsensis]EAQ03935.1 core-2/I-branching enzyme family protein [Pseudooceanicola batsensis HTCC2597]